MPTATVNASFQVMAATPQTPTGLRGVSSTTTSITIAWNTVSPTPDSIEIGHVVNGSVQTILQTVGGSQTTATISGLNPAYPETVEVRSSLNGRYSPWSASVVVQTKAVSVPAIPTGLHQISSTTSSIVFGWNAVSGADQIQLGHVINGAVQAIVASVAGNATQATVSGLNAGYPETVEIRAGVNGQYSPWSAAYQGSTQSATSGGGGGGTSSTCDALRSQLSSLMSQAQAIQANYNNQISSLTNQRNALIAQNQQLCNQITAAGGDCYKNSTFIATGNEISSLYNQIQSLQQQEQQALAPVMQQIGQVGNEIAANGC